MSLNHCGTEVNRKYTQTKEKIIMKSNEFFRNLDEFLISNVIII